MRLSNEVVKLSDQSERSVFRIKRKRHKVQDKKGLKIEKVIRYQLVKCEDKFTRTIQYPVKSK